MRALARSSAVPENRESCFGASSTGLASPPERGSTSRVTADFRRPCGLSRSSDFWRVIVLRSCVLRTTACAGPARSPWVSCNRFRGQPVATTPAAPMHFGLRRCTPAHPPRTPYGASLSFGSVTHLGFHRTPPRGPNRGLPFGFSTAGDLVLQIDALSSSVSGSLHQGPGFGLSPSYLLRLPGARARLASLALRALSARCTPPYSASARASGRTAAAMGAAVTGAQRARGCARSWPSSRGLRNGHRNQPARVPWLTAASKAGQIVLIYSQQPGNRPCQAFRISYAHVCKRLSV